MRILCLFLSIVAVCGDLESGQLIVNSPKSLADKYESTEGAIPMKPAMFGIPAYGHQAQLTGRVVYVPVDDRDGCKEINKTELVGMPPSGSLVVMVVERGQCTFVTKVQHAQDAGANACIIVDNQDEDRLPYMADDGKGSTISIPSMLIHKTDGANIAASIGQDGEKVIMTMSWNVPHPDNVVEWEFWTNSHDPISAKFKIQFDEAAVALDDSALMTPHYYFDNGHARDCVPSTPNGELSCGNRCSNNGRYCVFTADDPASKLTGQAAMEENLRQICLFKHVNETAKDAARTQWWNYVENFLKTCTDKDFTKACSDKVMNGPGVNVSPSIIQECVDHSGGSGPRSGANSLLDAELSRQSELAIFFVPTILINGVAYRGSIDCPKNEVGSITSMTCGVLEEICLGFLNSSAVPACTSPPDCKLGLQKDPDCNICGGQGLDLCGTCAQPKDPNYNKACAGCDGVPNSGKKLDNCNACGGPGRDACGNCFAANDTRRVNNSNTPGACQPAAANSADNSSNTATVSPGIVVVIVLVLISVVGVAVFFYMRHRQNALKQDIDALLKQYLPMEASDRGSIQA